MSKRYNRIKRLVKEDQTPNVGKRDLTGGWRKKILREFGEWAPIETSGPANSTSTTFGYFSGGSPVINFETGQQVTFTYSGLDGVENYPTSVTIDQGGGDIAQVDPPPFSQIGVQGYTAKLNPKYAEAKKKYDEEYAAWEKARDENFQKIKNTLKSFGTSFEELRASKKWVKRLGDGTFVALMPTAANADLINWTNNVRVVKLKQAANADPMYIDYDTKKIDPLTGKKHSWMAYNVEIQNDVYLGIGERPKPPVEQEYLIPRRTDFKDVNPQLDASQEFAQQVGADEFMNARVQSGEFTPEQKAAIDAWNAKLQAMMDRHGREWEALGRRGYTKKQEMALAKKHAAEINPLWDAEPKFDTTVSGVNEYNPGYVPYPNPNNYKPVSAAEKAYVYSLQTVPGLVNVVSTILGNDEGSAATPADWALQYARGDYTPITKSPGTAFNRNTMELISIALDSPNTPRGSVQTHTYNDRKTFDYIRDTSIRNSLGQFNYRVTPNGIEISDTFNFSGNTSIGALGVVDDIVGRATGGLVDRPIQRNADKLVDIGYRSALEKGQNPADDKHGIPIKYTIPWSEVPAKLQNKLDPNQRLVPIVRKRNRRGGVVESTWSKINKHRSIKEHQTPYTGTRDFNGGWRKKILSESDWTPVSGSIANSTSQTFVHTTGATTTVSGLGGVETTPSTVTIDAFGDTFDVPAPEYGQLGMQGYAPPLGEVQRKTQQTENEKIDAEQRKLKEQIIQLEQKRNDLLEEQNQKEPKYTGMTRSDFIDRTNEINSKWNEKTGPLGKIIYGSSSESERAAAYDKYYEYEDARIDELDALDAEYKSQGEAHDKKLKDHYDAYRKKLDSLSKEEEALYAKIDELEKQRPINQQLNASQQAYPNLSMMNARVQSAAGTRQSSFSTSDTSPDSYDDYLRDEGMEDPWDGADGPQYSRFGPFRSPDHFDFEAGKISERYRKKINAVHDYYSDGVGAYSSMRPVMNLEAERDSLIRELSIKKTAQDRAYNKAMDRYIKKLEAEKLAKRARADAAPVPPGAVRLPLNSPYGDKWSSESGSTTPQPALRDYRNTYPLSPARNTSPISPAMSANIGTAGKIMIDYLTKDWNNRVVADNEYLGRDYIDKQFFPNVSFSSDKTHVGGGDAVVGNGQPPRVDPKTGEIVVRANFDFNRNDHEAFGATGEDGKRKQEYAKRLERLKYMSDTTLRMPDMFDYTLDTMMDFLPGILQIPAALPVSAIVAGSKSIGRGNNIPIVIRFTPQELKRKNKKQYDKLVNMGLIKESTFDKIKKYR